MSPEWLAAVAAACPRPNGTRSAMRAVTEWCLATPGDTRAKWLIEADSSEAGGAAVGRALWAGGWNGLELDALAEILANAPERFAAQFLERRNQ